MIVSGPVDGINASLDLKIQKRPDERDRGEARGYYVV